MNDDSKIQNISKKFENVQMLPIASECIQMHPHRSEWIWKPWKACAKNLKKLAKTLKNFAKTSKNFAKNLQKLFSQRSMYPTRSPRSRFWGSGSCVQHAPASSLDRPHCFVAIMPQRGNGRNLGFACVESLGCMQDWGSAQSGMHRTCVLRTC